jgi:hypothetical protein
MKGYTKFTCTQEVIIGFPGMRIRPLVHAGRGTNLGLILKVDSADSTTKLVSIKEMISDCCGYLWEFI